MRLRSVLVLLAIALVVIPLVACGGDEGTTDTTAAATATTAAGTATTAAAGAPAGEQVDMMAPQALLDAIAAGVKDDAVVRPLAGRVVSSATLANVYFVAMEFSGSMENFKGIWATDNPEGTGNFWAVDKVAQKNTTWPKGSDADPKITEDDPAAQQALSKL
ncbi:MAG: hypothetical protein JW990_20315 [Thermoleophilia bacterium]|nr:hypothetical protein [Thermoleophilia bacterium]